MWQCEKEGKGGSYVRTRFHFDKVGLLVAFLGSEVYGVELLVVGGRRVCHGLAPSLGRQVKLGQIED